MARQDQKTLAQQDGRGREATTPTQIPKPGWKDIVWRLYQEIGKDRVMLIAAGVTYYLLLALVPTLSAFVSIYGLFTDPTTVTDHLAMLQGVVPPGATDIIQEQLTRLASEGGTTLGITLFISLGLALWSASAGVKALFEAMNVAYDEEEGRNFFQLNALALLFTLGGIVAIVVMLGVVVVLPSVLSALNLGGLEWLVQIVSYVGVLLLLSLGVACLYRWGPSRQQAKWRWITPGTVLTVIATLLVSVLFSWYVSNFGNYNATYGSLGALIGLLTWLWLTVTILIIGAELNSEVEHQTARDSTTGAERPLGARGAHMADHVGGTWGSKEEEVEGSKAPGTRSAGGSSTPHDERSREGRPVRRPISVGTLAVALPAALVLRWMSRRQQRS